MALYSYEAFSKDGKKVKGVIDATSQAVVREQLVRQELYPIAIYLATEESRLNIFQRMMQGNVTLKEKILFTKQLAVLLKSGVPLLQSLELLIDQFKGRLHSVLIHIKDEVKGGRSLADMMGQYPKIFDTIYVQLVRAGEASGKLDAILERLSEFLERTEQVKSRIRSAMQYPIVQMVIAIGVVIILLTAVVPQLQGLFEAQGENLPTTTKIMMAASEAVKSYFLIVIAVVGAIVAAVMYWKRTESGRRIMDTLKIKLPVIKYVARTNVVVQFCYTLGLLIESGVNLAEALDIVVKIVDNSILRKALVEARDKIIKQGKIAQYLKETDVFPPIAIYLIRTGEETGQLGQMLLLIAKNYETDLNEMIDRATGLISPIMLIFMALIVGFIIMAIAGPIMQGGQAFGLEGA
ncbi:MAG TPA: type II secretion system F family protein [Candidatus Babeliales bacterium]|nr:type II secretion system F family protein [Candidatus Babeliales bacterium]